MTTPITVLLTGAKGQLGYELRRSCPAHIRLIPTDTEQLNITRLQQVEAAIAEYKPDCIINCAAYTAVDKAESDQEMAYAINATGVQLLAEVCLANKKRPHLIHVSTDFVFDGQANQPYAVDAPTTPLGVYGASKLAGEQALKDYPNALTIRTSWLYSAHGANFVKTMLRLMNEKDQLGVIYDQVGSPTWAFTLAETIWALQAKNTTGVLHCSDNGIASWYDFALAIQDEALTIGLLAQEIPVKPIRSSQYPTPAKRPAYSVMDKSLTEEALGKTLPYWRDTLRMMLSELKQQAQTV